MGVLELVLVRDAKEIVQVVVMQHVETHVLVDVVQDVKVDV